MRDGHSNPHSSALISVWALTSAQTAKQTLNDGCSSLRSSQTRTYNTQNIQDTVSPPLSLWAPIKCILFLVYIDSIMSKSMTHPLVQYVSKQQCLKKMELPYPFSIADCEKRANKNFGYQETILKMYSFNLLWCIVSLSFSSLFIRSNNASSREMCWGLGDEIMHQTNFPLGHGTCLDVCDDVKIYFMLFRSS